MSEVLTDLSTPALIRAIKANLYEFFSSFRRVPQAEYLSGPKLTRWHTQFQHPWFNGMLITHPASVDGTGDEAQTIQAVVEYFKSRQVAAFTCWLDPALSTADWGRYLQPLGFKLDANTPGMAIDIQELQLERSALSSLRISPVEVLAALREWTSTFVTGYEIPVGWTGALYDLMAGLGIDLPVRNYIGYLDGKAVAASSLFLGAGVAGIYCVATLPEARRMGIGAMMPAAPLKDARLLGYRVGILQASDQGLPVHRRMGFTKLCDMEYFYYPIAS